MQSIRRVVMLVMLLALLPMLDSVVAMQMHCSAVSAGAETSAPSGSIQNVGQTAIGLSSNATTWMRAGMLACLTAQGPYPVTAVSRKNHGLAGVFDIDVRNPAAVECRSAGPTTLIVSFDGPIQGAGGLDASDVLLSSGAVTGVAIAANTLTVQMTGTADASLLNVSFPGILDAVNHPCNARLCFAVLVGDTNGDRAVNLSDMLAVRDSLNAAAVPANFRRDLSADGQVNLSDMLAVRDHLNAQVGAICP